MRNPDRLGPALDALRAAWLAAPDLRLGQLVVAAMRAAQCRTYRVPTEQAEEAVRAAVVRARGTPGWVETMRQLYAEAGDVRVQTEAEVTAAKARVTDANAQIANTLGLVAKASAAVQEMLLLGKLEDLNAQLVEAQRDVGIATARASTSGKAWERAAEVCTETLQIGAAWDAKDWSAVERILDWWVDAIEIRIDPRGTRRSGVALDKTLLLYLHTTPDAPHLLPVRAHDRSRDATGVQVEGRLSRRSRPSGRTRSRPGGAP